MLIDGFIFFNELDVLEIRLETLWERVDKFILVEAAYTFQGDLKPLYFEENRSRFEKYLSKIEYIVVHEFPEGLTPFEREHFQRDAISWGVPKSGDGFFMLSDVDEIPNPEVIPYDLKEGVITLFKQRQYYYKLNLKCVEQPQLPCTLIIKLKDFKPPSILRKMVFEFHKIYISQVVTKGEYDILENGGWHFSFLGNASHITKKIESFAHDELNLPEFKNSKNIEKSIEEGADIFGRQLTYKRVDFEEMPDFVSKNLVKFEKIGFWMGLKNSPNPQKLDSEHQNSADSFDGRENERRKMLIMGLQKTIHDLTSWNHDLVNSLNQRDDYIADLNIRLQVEVQERDRYIENINKSVEEVSVWAKSLEAELIRKNKEAVEISDWAIQLKNQLDDRGKSQIHKRAIRAGVKLVRQLLRMSKALMGKARRYFICKLQCHTKTKAVTLIEKSIAECNGQLIIAFPIITWDFRWQRPQHILSGLRDAGFSILYLAMKISPFGRRFRSASEAMSQISFNCLEENINQIWMSSSSEINIYSDPIIGDDLHNLTMSLSLIIKKLQPKSIKYIVQFPGWAPIALKLRQELGGKVIFDCMDDHTGFSTNSSEALESELNLIKNADLVIASSNLLEQKVLKSTNKVIKVKNATEFEHFYLPKKNGLLDQYISSPIIGYYGAISDWFDVKLLAHCARNRPQYNFVLIGSTFGADVSDLENLENVFLLGEKAYQSLPGYLGYFDVCLIPFKVIPLTMATNPVKFYEYLSAGKPVVSVRLPELIEYADCCYLADNPDEFLNQIDEAYKSKDSLELKAMRLELARANSWNSRVDAILKNSCFEWREDQ